MKGRPRTDEVYAALLKSRRTRGRMPTIKEICGEVDISRKVLLRVITRLHESGHIVKHPFGTLPIVIAEGGGA